MSERNIIAIVDGRKGRPVQRPAAAISAGLAPSDRLGRPLRDLRLSVTDRCNFRCGYCMPREVFDKDHAFLPQSQLLTFEEMTRVAEAFALLGVRKLRITGGEPLLRKNVERLVTMLAAVRDVDGQPLDLTLTTNGSLLARKAKDLAAAGLRRVTVSLDAMDDAVFRRMNDADFPVSDVLAGIEAAQAVGLGPIKVNMVVQRGINDQEIVPMAQHFRGTGVALRFIEFMDVGATNGWRMDQVLPSAEVRQRLHDAFPLVPLPPSSPGETAERWAYADGAGEVGFISSVTRAFCGDCNRARLSTEGQLYLCLFADSGHDLRSLIRPADGHPPCSAVELAAAVAAVWQKRGDQYSVLRGRLSADASNAGQRRIEMSYIGG